MATGRAPSSTPVPTTETAETTGATSTVAQNEWEIMAKFLRDIVEVRSTDEKYAYDSTWGIECRLTDTAAKNTTPRDCSSVR